MGGRGGEGGRTRLLFCLSVWPLTTHPFRDGTPSLLSHRQHLGVQFLFFIFCIKKFAYPFAFLIRGAGGRGALIHAYP